MQKTKQGNEILPNEQALTMQNIIHGQNYKGEKSAGNIVK